MYCPWDGIAETAEHIANARKSSDEWSSVFLGAEHAEQAPALVEALNERGVRFFGAIFPGLINGSEWSANGLLLNQWRMVTSPRFVRLGNRSLIGTPTCRVWPVPAMAKSRRSY